LASIPQAAPGADFRVNGAKIRRETHRSSGRTAIHAAITVHDPKPPEDPDSPLSYTMEGYYGPMPSALVPYFWSPSWNSVRAVNKFQDEMGGSLRGGDPGIRLIEPASGAVPRYYDDVPEAFAKRDGEWLIVPLQEIFGSEELSRLAPAVAERVSPSYLALNALDATGLRIAEGAMVAVDLDGDISHLPVRVRPGLPSGVGGMVVGLSGSIGTLLPAWGKLIVPPGAAVGKDGHHELIGFWHRQRLRHPDRAGWFRGFPDLDRATAAWLFSGSLRAEPRRPVRHLPGCRRHDQDPVQGGLDPAFRGPRSVCTGASDRHGRAADCVRRDPDRSRHRRGQPQYRAAVLSRDDVARRLQHRARRLGVKQQILAHGRRSSSGADGELRSLHGTVAGRRRPDGGFVRPQRHRPVPTRPVVHRPAIPGFRRLSHRRHCRDAPAPVRFARSGERTDCWIPYRIFRDEVRHLLHRRVRRHRPHLGDDRDIVPGWLAGTGIAAPGVVSGEARRLRRVFHPAARGATAASIRSADGLWLEGDVASRPAEYRGHRRCAAGRVGPKRNNDV